MIYQAGFLQFLSTIFSAGCEACSDDYSDSRLSVNEKRGEDRSCWMDEAALVGSRSACDWWRKVFFFFFLKFRIIWLHSDIHKTARVESDCMWSVWASLWLCDDTDYILFVSLFAKCYCFIKWTGSLNNICRSPGFWFSCDFLAEQCVTECRGSTLMKSAGWLIGFVWRHVSRTQKGDSCCLLFWGGSLVGLLFLHIHADLQLGIQCFCWCLAKRTPKKKKIQGEEKEEQRICIFASDWNPGETFHHLENVWGCFFK